MLSPSSSDSTPPPSTPPSDMYLNNTNHSNASGSGKPQRKASRRASTAERRATHNAVERARREVLNGRFLDLAKLLPNLSQVRRPSKSSIVNSSIAHFHASRRHRAMAARELRLLKMETDQLRMELNEWRGRAGIPGIEEPIREEGFSMVLNQELEVVPVVNIGEDEEEGSVDDDFGMGDAPPQVSASPEEHHATPIPIPASVPTAPVPVPTLNINTNVHHLPQQPAYTHPHTPQYAPPLIASPTGMSFDNPALGMYDGHVPNYGGYRQRSGSVRSRGSDSPPQYQMQKLSHGGYEMGWVMPMNGMNMGMMPHPF